MLFYEKAKRLEAQRRANFIADVRMSVWAEGKDLERLVEVLSP